MSAAVADKLMTTEEFLALPDDGVERWLINGQLRENGMTVRNRFHSRLTTRVAKFLDNWLDDQPQPHGTVLSGEAGIRLGANPDVTVGIDVAYLNAELAQQFSDDITLVDGIPTLVVEILSPSDTQERIHEKLDCYRNAGVPLIWVIDPDKQTVMIYRPEKEPQLVTRSQELSGDPELPGFRVAAAK